MLVVAAALFGMFFFCTLYLQQVLGYSALKTGIAYLPLSLTIIGASGLASRFVDRFTPKPVLVAGLLISTVGFVLLTRVSGHGDYASHVAPAMVVLGAGLGTSFVPITIAATNGVGARRLWTGLGAAEHHAASRWLAGPGDPVLGLDQPRNERAARRLVATGGTDARIQGRVHRRGGALRSGHRPGGGAAPTPAARDRARTGRGDRAVLCPLPRCAVLRAPGARGRHRPPHARRRRAVGAGPESTVSPEGGPPPRFGTPGASLLLAAWLAAYTSSIRL